MNSLVHIAVSRPMSGVLSRKYIKLDELLSRYVDLLEKEDEAVATLEGRERSYAMENLYNEMKSIDAKVGKIWDTLSGEQQVELWNNTQCDLQFVYDGF